MTGHDSIATGIAVAAFTSTPSWRFVTLWLL